MKRNLYRVTGRAFANVIFLPGDSITANYVRDEVKGTLTLSTRYIERGFPVPIPGDFSVLINVEAASVEEAATWVTVGRELASIVSISANAAILPLQGELIYDVTPGKAEREHFQRFTRADEGTFSSRAVPMQAAVALLSAVATHHERDRIIRAITQYCEALQRWEIGNELPVVSHLWMGVEAIKTAYLRTHLEQRGMSKTELAAEWGFDPKGRLKLDAFLQGEARLRLVFQGDSRLHRIAKDVSDSFEHGFANGGKLFAPARDALMPTARFLRDAIMSVAGVSDEDKKTMLSAPYDIPRGPRALEQYFRSKLVGEGEQLAADGHEHPMWDWSYSMNEVTFDTETRRYQYVPDHNLTARIGPGVNLVGGELEVWDAGIYMPQATSHQKDS